MLTADMSNGTPLVRARGNPFAKLELFNRGGSHKARAAARIVRAAIEAGELAPGGERRILEKSGGNFGVGLAYEARKFNIGVDLVIGLSFSPVKRALCEEYGARLVGRELLEAGLQPREVIERLIEEAPNRYFYTNQFSNPHNLAAHHDETGPELITQLVPMGGLDRPVIVVLAAGTGASASGISKRLKAVLPRVTVVLNEPEGCSYRDGLFAEHAQKGTAVGVVPPFLDFSLIDQIMPVSDAEAFAGQKMLAADTGLYPGPSSGGNYFLACQLAAKYPNHLVVTLIYDAGEGYLEGARLMEALHGN